MSIITMQLLHQNSHYQQCFWSDNHPRNKTHASVIFKYQLFHRALYLEHLYTSFMKLSNQLIVWCLTRCLKSHVYGPAASDTIRMGKKSFWMYVWHNCWWQKGSYEYSYNIRTLSTHISLCLVRIIHFKELSSMCQVHKADQRTCADIFVLLPWL